MHIKSHYIEPQKFEEGFKEFKDIPFSFFFDCQPTDYELSLNPINVYAHAEPNEYFGNHDWILNNSEKFSLILTWNESIIKKCNNSQTLLYGEAWVKGKEEIENKEFEISFIRGNKLQSYGHLIRHQLFNRKDEISIPYRFYEETKEDPIKGWETSKIMAHQPAMFSLIIENVSHHNFFTEKITDCILMNSIPVYWGCTNIEKYYNKEGIIQVYSDDDAIEKINNLTPEYYNERKDIIKSNFNRAFEYGDYLSRISDKLEEVFKLNDLLK